MEDNSRGFVNTILKEVLHYIKLFFRQTNTFCVWQFAYQKQKVIVKKVWCGMIFHVILNLILSQIEENKITLTDWNATNLMVEKAH